MIFFWSLYFFSLTLICYFFSRIIKNRFIKYFFIPIILGIFGSIWFINPGSTSLAPTISIMFLESSILESNKIERLLRPMISTIFILEMLSLALFVLKKRK